MIQERSAVPSTAGQDSNGRLAFARALQQSETRRLQLLLGVLAILVLLATLRYLFGGTAMNSPAYPARLIVLIGATMYAVMIMGVVRRAAKKDRLLPAAFWTATAVFESTIPTLNIITLIKFAPIEPVDTVAAPAMIVYFLFSILSVLRLRPAFCLLSGGLSAVQHAALVLWTLNESAGATALNAYYLSYSVLILTVGVCVRGSGESRDTQSRACGFACAAVADADAAFGDTERFDAGMSSFYISLSVGVNTMAGKTFERWT